MKIKQDPRLGPCWISFILSNTKTSGNLGRNQQRKALGIVWRETIPSIIAVVIRTHPLVLVLVNCSDQSKTESAVDFLIWNRIKRCEKGRRYKNGG